MRWGASAAGRPPSQSDGGRSAHRVGRLQVFRSGHAVWIRHERRCVLAPLQAAPPTVGDRREHHRLGVADVVLEAGFELGLAEIVAFTLPHNVASRRVMEKSGLTYEKSIEWAGHPHVLYRIRSGSSNDG